jgi:hypothetical protein
MCLKPKEIKPLGQTNVCQSNDFRQKDVDPTVYRPSGFRPKDAKRKKRSSLSQKKVFMSFVSDIVKLSRQSLSKVSEFQRKI